MRTSIWKGSISFGLINIPVTVQTAQQDKDIHFNLLDERNLSPIKYKRINAKTGKEVPNEKIVKGYPYEKGKFVIMTDKDFQAANPKATQTIDILDFVSMDDIDLLLFDRPYYLAPQKGGEKGYFLLHEALKKTNKVAVAKVVMHTKQHLCCVFVREDYLILELLRFAHTVKEPEKVNYLEGAKGKGKYSPAELKMAEHLVNSMTAKWKPEDYEDTYYKDLMAHIKRKITAGEGKDVELPSTSHEEVAPTKMEDIMTLLKQSIEGGGKAPATKSAGKRAKKAAPKSKMHHARKKPKSSEHKHLH